MAEQSSDSRKPTVQQGILARTITGTFRILQWLLLSLVFSVLVEWAGMLLWWPEQGLDHSREMLEQEIGYLNSDFRRSIVSSDPARFARRMADRSYHYLFEATGVVDFILWASMPASPRRESSLPCCGGSTIGSPNTCWR